MGVIPTRFARRIDADTIGLYTEDLTKLLQLDKAIANTTTLEGSNTAGDDLVLKANSVDNLSKIVLQGGSNLYLGSQDKISISSAAASTYLDIQAPTGDVQFGTYANRNVYLAPNGTGLVKFGTHSALAGETLSGYITIKDSGGTSRKLAVIS